jgi:hypothetical protein
VIRAFPRGPSTVVQYPRRAEVIERMRTKILVMTAVLVLASAATGLAVGGEIGVGTEPSVSFAATWDLSPSFAVVTSFGAVFWRGVQTGSSTLPSTSYTVGVEARYEIRFLASAVRPYLGLGALAQTGSEGMSAVLSSTVGAQVRMLRNIFLFGEGSALLPVLDASSWYWRFKLGIGFRF